MIEKKHKDTSKQADFMQVYVLTQDDRQQLIEQKLARAQAYHEAWKKREALLAESR